MTIRRRILNAMILEMAKAEYGMVRVHGFEPATFEQGQWPDPSAFVWADADAPADGIPDTSAALESFKSTVAVEVWGKGVGDEYIAKVHKAMSADRSWGGLALDTDLKASEVYTVDSARDYLGVKLFFNLFYRHYSGNPYSLAGEAPPDIPVGGENMQWVEGGDIYWVEGGIMTGVG